MDDEKPPLYEVDFETGKTRIVPEPTPDARLRAALEPFAKLAKEIENLGANMVLADTDGLSIVLGMTPTLDEPVLGDLREAAAALEAAPEAWRASFLVMDEAGPRIVTGGHAALRQHVLQSMWRGTEGELKEDQENHGYILDILEQAGNAEHEMWNDWSGGVRRLAYSFEDGSLEIIELPLPQPSSTREV